MMRIGRVDAVPSAFSGTTVPCVIPKSISRLCSSVTNTVVVGGSDRHGRRLNQHALRTRGNTCAGDDAQPTSKRYIQRMRVASGRYTFFCLGLDKG